MLLRLLFSVFYNKDHLVCESNSEYVIFSFTQFVESSFLPIH